MNALVIQLVRSKLAEAEICKRSGDNVKTARRLLEKAELYEPKINRAKLIEINKKSKVIAMFHSGRMRREISAELGVAFATVCKYAGVDYEAVKTKRVTKRALT